MRWGIILKICYLSLKDLIHIHIIIYEKSYKLFRLQGHTKFLNQPLYKYVKKHEDIHTDLHENLKWFPILKDQGLSSRGGNRFKKIEDYRLEGVNRRLLIQTRAIKLKQPWRKLDLSIKGNAKSNHYRGRHMICPKFMCSLERIATCTPTFSDLSF
jgi:hypothetical protein